MKNGIILIEYIEQLLAEGWQLMPALLHAGRVRFRPILMTSLAAVLGLLPLALDIGIGPGGGPGAQMQRPLAIAVIGGLLANMLFTRMVIPVGYLLRRNRMIVGQASGLTSRDAGLRHAWDYDGGMSDYRRYFVPGGTYFFTLTTDCRRPIFRTDWTLRLLGSLLRRCQLHDPVEVVAIVVLPDHLHTLWTLPPGDNRYLPLELDQRRVHESVSCQGRRRDKSEAGAGQRTQTKRVAAAILGTHDS